MTNGRGYTSPDRWQLLRKYGAWFAACQALLWLTWPLWRWWFRLRPSTFLCAGHRYPYFFHRYNFTWSNERAVEVPLIWSEVQRCAGGRVLEVGRVLPHYFDVRHEVVDRFERAAGVKNIDVLEVSGEYDLIVSISTLEHVGWDEEPRDPQKVVRAVEHLAGLLAPGGLLIATVPLGYNPHLDRLLQDGSVPFDRRRCFRRIGSCRWREATWDEIAGSRYGEPFPSANGLVVGMVDR